MSTRIPQAFIDELISRTDIVELINAHVPLKKKGKEYAACCPFHNEKTASFTVSPEKQFYHCFGCGAHGTALGFLMEYERLDFIEAVQVLAQQNGLEIPQENAVYIKNDHQNLYDLLQRANIYFQQNLRQQQSAISYLKNRGVSGDIAAKYDLGYALDSFDDLLNEVRDVATDQQLVDVGLIKKSDKSSGHYDRFRNRIIFPIKDRRGRVIGFGGRVLDDAIPKYLNSPETPVFHKSDALYGLYEARKSKHASKSLIVVEGYMDVIALAQHGINNVVATLGTATTGQHIQQLYRCTQEIVFCFDGDRAGKEAAWRAAQQTIPLFSDGLEARFLFLPQGEDPDSLIRTRGKEIFLEYISDGESLSSFIFAKLSEDINVHSPSGKARLANMAKPLLEKLPNGVFKKLVFKELEQKIGTTIQYAVSNNNQDLSKHPSINKATPVRLAIAALLHHPALALEVEISEQLNICTLSGVPLLLNLIGIWKKQPELSPAVLLERFRGQKEEQQIEKLLTWNPPELDEPKKALFDALSWIERKAQDMRVQELIEKESNSGLSEQERQEIKNLLHQKAS